MMNARRSIRERWCSTAVLIAFAVMLAVCIAPAMASAATPQVSAGGDHTIATKSDGSGTWWDSNWSYCKQLTINHTYVNGSQTDFPMMINITDDDLRLKARQDGNDIVFVSSDDTIQLDHQIEGTFNSTTGHLKAWIRIPTLSNTSDTVINMYYNNSVATNTENSSGVWGVNASGIWLMDEGTGGAVNDSSGNGNHGVNNGADWVADGLDFNGTTDFVNGSISGPANCVGTVSCWIYPYTEGEGYEGRITMLKPLSGWNALFFDNAGTNQLSVGISDGSNDIARTGTNNDITLNAWNHVVYSYDGSAGGTGIKIYVNGAEVTYSETTGSEIINATPSSFVIGANDIDGDYAFDGLINGIYVYDRVLSAEEIGTRYNNTNSPSTFSAVGAEQTPDTTNPVVNTVALNNSTPNTGDAILVSVNATDNIAVTNVTANGVELISQGGDIWNGTITALNGNNSVNVSAKDVAGNTGWNNSTSYNATTTDTTNPVVNTVALNNSTPNTGDAILVSVNATDNIAVTNVTANGVELISQGGDIWNGTITALNGNNSVNVSAKDVAGNTGWNNSTSYNATTTDTTNPVVNTVALDNDSPNTGDAILVTVNATDNVSVINVTANEVELTSQGDNIWNGTIIASEGTHSVNVSAKDAAGNTGWNNSTGYTATTPADTTDPVVNTVTLDNDSPNTGDAILVTVNATDNVSVINVTANEVELTSQGDNIWNGTIIASEGTHSVNVSAKDAAGNTGWNNSTGYTATTPADTTDPVVNTVTLDNDSPNTGDAILVTVNATDNVSVINVTANEVELTSQGDNIWNGTIIASEGTHSVNVSAKDAAGNTGWNNSTGYTATTPADTTDPVVNTVTLDNDSPNTGDAILVTVNATDNVSVINVTANEVELTSQGDNIWNGTIIASEGTHSVNVSAKDAAGNTGWNNSTGYTATTPADTTDPVVNTVTLDNDSPNTGDAILVTVNATDNVSVINVTANEVELTSQGDNIWNGTIIASEGTHSVNVSAKDAAGNTGWNNSTGYTATTPADTTDPVVNTVTLDNDSPNTGDAILVTVNATDNVSVINVTANEVELTSQGDNIWNGTIIASEGTHSVNVSAKDAAGNTGWNNSTGYTATTPADTTDPVVNTVTLDNDSPNTGDAILVTVNATDNVSVINVTANEVELTSQGDNIWNGTIIASEGTHSVNVSAKDAAGNTGWNNSTGYTATTPADTTDPVVNTVTLDNDSPNTGDAILVTVNATDNVSVINVTANEVELTSQGDNIWNGTIIASEGTHSVNVSAKDAAGNTGWNNSTGYTATTPADTTDPVVNTVTLDNDSPNTGDAILVTVNATDNVSVINVTANEVELTSQGDNIWNGTIIASEGTHSVNVSAKDAAGNTGWNNSTGYTATTPADTTDPVVNTVTLDNDSPNTGDAILVTVNATDNVSVINVTANEVELTSQGDNIWNGTIIASEGTHSVNVSAKDAAGNTGWNNSTGYTATTPADTTDPVVNTVTLDNDSPNTGDAILVTVNATDNVSVINVTANEVELTSQGDNIWNGTIIASEGTHSVNVSAKDAAGNTGWNNSTGYTATTPADTTDPVVNTVTLDNDSPNTGDAILVTVNATDNVSVINVTANEVELTSQGDNIWNGTIIASEGTHSVNVSAKDAAGNTGWNNSTGYTATTPADTTDPVVNTVTLDNDSPNTGDAILVTVNATDNVSVINVTANEVELTSQGDNIWNGTIIASEGTHSVNVSAKDAAGNTGWNNSTGYTATTPADTTDPVVNTVTLDNDSPNTGDAILVTVNATDNVSVINVTANEVELTSQGDNIWNGTIIASEGTHSVNVSAKDAAGNTGWNNSTGYTATTPADTTDPVVNTVTLDNDSPNTGDAILVTVNATDNVSVINVTANEVELTSQGDNIWNGTIIASEGTHSVNVSAKDAAGNTGWNNSTGYTATTPADTTDPVVNTVTLDNDSPNTGDAILVTVNATDNVSVINVTANEVELTSQGDNIWNGTIIASEGTHSVNVSAKDAAGNTGWNNSTGYTATTPDTTPPASITNLQNTTYEQTYINWTWADPLDADFAKVNVYIDGLSKGDVLKGVEHYNATELTPNTEYTISTHTVDTSGNVNETWVNDTAKTLPFSPLQRINVTPASKTLNINESWDFTATGHAQNGGNISNLVFAWSNSNPYVGSLNASTGTVVNFTAGHVGITYLTASSGGVTSDPVQVTVNAPAVSGDVTNGTCNVTSGNSTATVRLNNRSVNGTITIKELGDPLNSTTANGSTAGLGAGVELIKGVNITANANVTGALANDTNRTSWIHIKIEYNESQLGNIDENTLFIYKYVNGSGWVKLVSGSNNCTANGRNTTANYIWANVTHLCDFGAGGSAPAGSSGRTGGGGDGTYPPGWFGTPTPTVTATKAPTATPTATVAPPDERVTPRPTKKPEAVKTATPAAEDTTAETAKKGAPGFTAVFVIAGMLAVAYAMMRRRE